MRNSIIRLTHALAVMILAVIGIVQQASAGEIRYTLDLSNTELTIDSVVAPDGNTYTRIYTADCDFIGEPGEPMIPAKIINFLVPTYSTGFKVKVLSISDFRTIRLSNSLLNNIYKNLTSTAIDSKGRDNSLGNESPEMTPLVYNEFFVNGNSHILQIAVPLASYKSDSNEASTYSSISFAIEYVESKTAIGFNPATNIEPSVDLSRLVVNPKPNPLPQETTTIGPRRTLNRKYYILTPDSLKDYLQDLVAWKRQTGYQVVVKTVEEILADNKYVIVDSTLAFDRESHIRNWLLYEYNYITKTEFPLLIIGDYRTSAPIRKFRYNRGSDPSYNWYDGENFIPSDSYFSALTAKFKIDNTSEGHYYGYLSEQELSYDISVGRLLAYKPEHIATYTKKLVTYQLDPGYGDRDYLNLAVVSRQNQHCYYKSLLQTFPVFSDSIVFNDTLGLNDFSKSRPTGGELIKAMGKAGMMSIQGHGSPYTIACSGRNEDPWNWRYIQAQNYYGKDETGFSHREQDNGLDKLDNIGRPSILYSLSCTITPFDNIRFDFGYRNNPYNMGDGFTVAGLYGGVALIGNTRKDHDLANRSMELKFGEEIYNGSTIGKAVALSNLSYPDRYAQFARNLIGDPEIKIWKGAPENILVNINVDNSFNSINLNGKELYGSKAVFYDGMSNPVSYMILSPNSATLTLSSFGYQKKGDFAVTVIKEDRLPLTKLFVNNSVIDGIHKRYFLTEAQIINNDFGIVKSFTIKNGGQLDLNLTQSLATQNAFMINNDGILSIHSENKVSLEGDIVESGGSLSVKSSEILIGKGFEIRRGGNLNVETKQ